jgi:hypothetical protein
MEIIDQESSVGLDREARLISFERSKILKSVPGTSVTLREHYCRNLFNILKNKWQNETMNYSSPNEIFNNINYKKIVMYGPSFIPYILEELQEAPYYWFHALTTITNQNPINETNMNDVEAMVADWIKWGEDNGY